MRGRKTQGTVEDGGRPRTHPRTRAPKLTAEATGIRAVSLLAGVSVATVSRTLSKPDVVSDRTRQKVLTAIEATGYTPNASARNFRAQKSFSILVLVPNIANPFFSRIIRGIERVAQEKSYSILLGDTQGDAEREAAYTAIARARKADGIIQLDARIPQGLELDRRSPRYIPFVNACDCVDQGDLPRVRVDNAAAARMITEHLLSLGHRRIGVVHGPLRCPIYRDRLSGYRKALAAAGLAFDPDLLVARNDCTMSSGRDAAGLQFARAHPPTALFCFNDEMAIGAIQRLRSAGRAIPADVSVAGFDDIDFASFIDPPLTTIVQPKEELGETAMTVLYELMSAKITSAQTYCLPVTLAVRGSTGPAPAKRP